MSAAPPLLNPASQATDLASAIGTGASQTSLPGGAAGSGVGHRVRGLAAKAGRAGEAAQAAADGAANQASQGAAAAPQTFADLLNRVRGQSGKSTTAQAAANAAAGGNAGASASAAQAALAAAQAAGQGGAQNIAAQNIAAQANAATAAAGASSTASGSGSADGTTASGTKAADAASLINDPTGPFSPLAGLAAILFSGPLQTPPSSLQATAQAQKVQTALTHAVASATPDQLASWKSALANMGQALNASEKQTTGVDPTSPPAGWTEPANFQAARSLLTALQGTISDAQTARGIALPPVQPAHAGTQNVTASTLQSAFKQKFQAPAPQGQATAKLFGQTAAASTSGGGASKAAGAASAAAQGQAQAQGAGPTVAVRTAAAQVTAPAAQKAAQKTSELTPPNARDVPLAVEPEAAPGKTATTTVQTAALAAGAAKAPAAQPPSVEKQLALAAAQAQSAQPEADQTAVTDADAAAGAAQSASAVSAANAGATTPAQAADPTRVTPQAVAYLASSIVNKANGKASSFSIELHPADLGRVEVKLQIEQDGRLAARMSFDNPAAAADFQARSDDLRRSLEQAGFQLSGDALSFSGRDAQTADGGSGGSAGQNGSGQSGPGGGLLADAASINANAADAAAASSQNLQAVGLDMRI